LLPGVRQTLAANSKPVSKPTDVSITPATDKKRYTKPTVNCYGTIAQLTTAGSHMGVESVMMGMVDMKMG